ncbi:MAG: accessory factor UbiK family protein [Oceanospirillaceae bacterium]|nr:accessory factor UbiK family protein [Oceanospirillaceae bacterium]
MNEKFIEGLSQQFSSLMSNLPKGADLPGQYQLKSLMQSALAKLDLVTRDEFDAQTAVLARTRQKVEALEVRMTALEASLNNEDS